MANFNIEAIGAQIRAMDFERGTPAEVAMWRDDDENSRANLAIEDMALEPDDAALFDLFRDEAVPPPLATQILLRLLDHPDADRTLPITPMMAAESR